MEINYSLKNYKIKWSCFIPIVYSDVPLLPLFSRMIKGLEDWVFWLISTWQWKITPVPQVYYKAELKPHGNVAQLMADTRQAARKPKT